MTPEPAHRLRHARRLTLLACAALLLGPASALYADSAANTSTSASSSAAYHRPTKGNQYISTTGKYLYVVWSVPNNLAPIAQLKDPAALEAFIARTAVHLCIEHASADASGNKPCKLQMVRMTTNDEYTKSAAGGFKTVAKLVLPRTHMTRGTLERALAMQLPELKALFERFEVKHSRLQPANTP